MKNKSARRRQQWFLGGIAALIIGSVVLALIAPGGNTGSSSSDSSNVLNPTASSQSVSIQPAMQGIGGGAPYIHPTGLYQIFRPNQNTNWGLDTQSVDVSGTRAITIYRGNCSVIYAYVDYGINFDTLEEVNENVLTSTYDAAEWALYEYDETSRNVGEKFIVTNYDLVRRETEDTQSDSCPDDYKGRQVTWLDDGLMYVVRLVVRNEDSAALNGLQDLILPTFVTFPNIADIIIDSTIRDRTWRVHPDSASPIEQTWLGDGAFIILPPDWRTDSGTAFQSYTGFGVMDGYQATLQSFPNTTLASLDDIEEWISSLRLDVEIVNNEPVENQRFGTGYYVSYTFENADGDQFSSVASILNDEDGTLHVAELTTERGGLDLLEDAPENDTISTAQAIIRSFTITPPDDYIYLP